MLSALRFMSSGSNGVSPTFWSCHVLIIKAGVEKRSSSLT